MYIIILVNKILRALQRIKQRLAYLEYQQLYGIEDPSFLRGFDINLYGDGKIKVGRRSYIGDRSSICAASNTVVSVGDDCAISHNVRIYTTNRKPKFFITEEGEGFSMGNVSIGHKVWIGCNCVILEGTVIGDKCVVGANSVVKGIFPPKSIIVGIPAKIVKSYAQKLD